MKEITKLNHLEVISFSNIDSEDFEGIYGGNPTLIKAGETRQFPRFLAQHFTKHLVNKILLKNKKDCGNKLARKKLEDMILGEEVVPEHFPSQAEKTADETEFAGKPSEPIVPINGKAFKCENCGQDFAAKIGLISHQRKHAK